MTTQDSPTPTNDPLWHSLERILAFYQVRPDKSLAESQIAIDWNKPLKPADIILISRHLGLELTIHAIAGIDIADLRRPALILLPDLRSLVSLPQDGAIPSLWVPEGAIDIDELCASRVKNLYVLEFDKPSAATTRADSDAPRAQWFWDLLHKQRRDYIDIGVATFFINLFMLMTPLFSMTVFDRVIPNHAHETLIAITIGIVLAFLFNFGFKRLRVYVLGSIVSRIATQLDTDFMNQLLRLSVPSYQLTVGERFDLFHELQGLRDFFASRFVPALVDMPFFIVFLFVLYAISTSIALVVAVGVVLLLAVNLICRPSINRTAATHFREARGKNAALVEILSGALTVRLFNAIGFTLFRWQRLAERVTESARRNQNMTELADELSLTIMSLISIFVIIAGVEGVEKGDMSLGGLVASNILVARTLSPVMNLSSVLGRLRQFLDSLKVIDSIFHMPTEPRIAADYEPKGAFKDTLRLNDITFYHHGQVHPTLYHLSLDIRRGEKVGLIGRTGAGKSTIAQLLDGSLTSQSGHIFVDGLVLESIHPAEWRQNLGIVPQNPFIFSGTIKENILLGLKEVVDETWLAQVLALSGLDRLMQQAGYGLDFDVGEAGARLSGGQRQSLAIARALIRKPQILILDEPTNGMDNDLELRVKAGLQAYLKDKTLILVTHRTSLLSLVNRLVVIDQGKVATEGAPDDVIRRLSGKEQGATHA